MAAVILAVGASIATAAWYVIRSTSYEQAEARLTDLKGLIGTSATQMVTAAQSRAINGARRSEIVSLARGGPSDDGTAALQQIVRGGPTQLAPLAAEIRDRTGAVTHSSGPSDVTGDFTLSPAEWQQLMQDLESDATEPAARLAANGRLRAAANAVFYPVVVPIGGTSSYYVEWRRLAGSTQRRDAIADLIGSDAVVLVGNADGTAWSDSGAPLPGPMPPLRSDAINWFSRPGRGDAVASVVDVPDAPWRFAIEFSRRDIEAPARKFLRAVGVIGVAAIGLGVLVGWGLGRRITAPVQSLTTAADAIAAGEVTRRVPPLGEDEFGKLGRSFNLMADEVQRSRDTLEEQVAERTRELREARESLARREKLTLIAHLAGGVGHEIRNPLGVMSNAIYYLEAVQKDAPKQVRDYLALLRQQVNITAKIVNDLLDMSRTTPAQRQVVHVKDLVEPRLERLNGTPVERDLPADLPAVEVDPVHAGQVLDNLFENAVQAMGGQGTIHVRARDTQAGFVRIEIADTGPGIRPEHMDKVFEPLFTTKARGIGLGLAVSKSLAQANGGDLALASVPGEGARFAFTLPVAGGTA